MDHRFTSSSSSSQFFLPNMGVDIDDADDLDDSFANLLLDSGTDGNGKEDSKVDILLGHDESRTKLDTDTSTNLTR